jgi:hypothetical protein
MDGTATLTNATPIERPSISANSGLSGNSSGPAVTSSSRTVASKVESMFDGRMSVWALVTFRDRNINDFNFYLKLLMLANIMSLCLEVWLITVIFSNKVLNIVLQVLCIFAAVHATLNIVAVKILQSRLSLNACVISCINTFVVLAIFVAQILVGNIYYKPSQREFAAVFVVNILQIASQFVAMMVMYRFWEYLMYNHDFGGDDSQSESGRSSRMASMMEEELNNPTGFTGKRMSDALLT